MGTPSPDWLPPEVAAAIQSGRTIEAIKLLRESTGLGLAEAKAAVDHYARTQGAPPGVEAPLPPDVMQALRNGNKIEAIRLVREHRGLGLREAKLLVDALEAGEPLPHGNLSPVAPRRSSPLLWLAIVLAVAAYIIYRVLGGS